MLSYLHSFCEFAITLLLTLFPPPLVPISELLAGAEAERTSQVSEEHLCLITLPLHVFEVSTVTPEHPEA